MTEQLSLAFLPSAAPGRQTERLPSQQLQGKDCVLTFPVGAGGPRVLAHGWPLHPQVISIAFPLLPDLSFFSRVSP